MATKLDELEAKIPVFEDGSRVVQEWMFIKTEDFARLVRYVRLNESGGIRDFNAARRELGLE